MKLPSVILVPTDFGPASQAALDYALELATRFGARQVVVLHTYEIPIVSFPDGVITATAEMTSRIVDAASYELAKTMERVADRGVSVSSMLREGEPTRVVAKVTEELGADLVVLGTHGRHGLSRVLIGSVAERIVRTSTVPVLTVHAAPAEERAAREGTAPNGRAAQSSR